MCTVNSLKVDILENVSTKKKKEKKSPNASHNYII